MYAIKKLRVKALLCAVMTAALLSSGIVSLFEVPAAKEAFAADIVLDATTCSTNLGGSWNSGTSRCFVTGVPVNILDRNLVLIIPEGVTLAATTITNNRGTINVFGTFDTSAGIFSDKTINVSGTLRVIGNTNNLGTISITGTFENGNAVNSPTLTNSGTITISGTFTNSGTFNNDCTGIINGSVSSGNQPVNICPPVANGQSVTTNEDAAKSITLTGTNPEADPDFRGEILTFTILTQPSSGTLSGTAPNLNYAPNANYNGPDSFTFRVNDGKFNSNVATLSLIVSAVNDPPVAADDAISTREDTQIFIDVLANDIDIDGDSLSVALLGPPTHGLAVVRPDNKIAYTPRTDFVGEDSFTYNVVDAAGVADSATVTITVSSGPSNSAPTADSQSITTEAGVPVSIMLTATDVEGDSLIFFIADLPSDGTLTGSHATRTYTPNPGFSGIDSFTFIAHDGTGISNIATVTITVTHTNSPPTADSQNLETESGVPITDIVLSGNDPDGDPLSFFMLLHPSNGGLSAEHDGELTYTPNDGFSGTDSFLYMAWDGALISEVATVEITVNPSENNPPVAEGVSIETDEGDPVSIRLVATDVDGDDLEFFVDSPPSHGILTKDGNSEYTYTPEDGFSGTDSFTFMATDGVFVSNIATVEITIDAIPNSDPEAQGDSDIAVAGQPVTIAVLINDSDDDGDTLTIESATDASNGDVEIDGNVIIYTPDENFSGTDTFTYTISDENGGTDTATVTIDVIKKLKEGKDGED